MPERKWMMHLDLTCGSLEFIGTDLAAEVIADLVAALQKLGVLKCREANKREAE